jgi:hypothetical protein
MESGINRNQGHGDTTEAHARAKGSRTHKEGISSRRASKQQGPDRLLFLIIVKCLLDGGTNVKRGE